MGGARTARGRVGRLGHCRARVPPRASAESRPGAPPLRASSGARRSARPGCRAPARSRRPDRRSGQPAGSGRRSEVSGRPARGGARGPGPSRGRVPGSAGDGVRPRARGLREWSHRRGSRDPRRPDGADPEPSRLRAAGPGRAASGTPPRGTRRRRPGTRALGLEAGSRGAPEAQGANSGGDERLAGRETNAAASVETERDRASPRRPAPPGPHSLRAGPPRGREAGPGEPARSPRSLRSRP